MSISNCSAALAVVVIKETLRLSSTSRIPISEFIQLFSSSGLTILEFWLTQSFFALCIFQRVQVTLLSREFRLTFMYPGASKPRRDVIYPWHVFLGIFLYVMAIMTAETGILEKLVFQAFMGMDRFSPEAMLVNSTGLVILIFAMLVVLSTILPWNPTGTVLFMYRDTHDSMNVCAKLFVIRSFAIYGYM